MEYVVVIRTAEEGGFWAEVPALDGCYAQGESVEDVRGAIASRLEAIREFGPAASEPREDRVFLTTVAV